MRIKFIIGEQKKKNTKPPRHRAYDCKQNTCKINVERIALQYAPRLRYDETVSSICV